MFTAEKLNKKKITLFFPPIIQGNLLGLKDFVLFSLPLQKLSLHSFVSRSL